MRSMTGVSLKDSTLRLRDWILGLAAVFLLLLAGSPAEAAGNLTGRVIAVVDGDTVDILDDTRKPHRIRFAWTDAPESGQAHGQAAKRALSGLVFGRKVVVDVVKEDRYEGRYGKRVIGSVFLGGHDVGLAMVALGHVWHYEPVSVDQAAGDRRSYAAAQLQARKRRMGLWQEPSPTPPWLWRREAKAAAALAPAP